MSPPHYHAPDGGLPPQSQLLTSRAVFTEAYAVIPGNSMTDIVVSRLPHWQGARFWVLARPMSGFSETFSQYIGEVVPGGGSDRPETDDGAEAAIFVVQGQVTIQVGEDTYSLGPGGFAFIPAGMQWRLNNTAEQIAKFHWIRKKYVAVEGIAGPQPIIANEADITPGPMPDTEGRWATTRFMDPEDLSHDMHVTIVTLQPGAVIPFMETHVMEHGLYVLQGKGVYKLNQDWVEVEAGDFMWLRAFCPQACYAGGPEPFRYLLYKDVNRHMPL